MWETIKWIAIGFPGAYLFLLLVLSGFRKVHYYNVMVDREVAQCGEEGGRKSAFIMMSVPLIFMYVAWVIAWLVADIVVTRANTLVGIIALILMLVIGLAIAVIINLFVGNSMLKKLEKKARASTAPPAA